MRAGTIRLSLSLPNHDMGGCKPSVFNLRIIALTEADYY